MQLVPGGCHVQLRQWFRPERPGLLSIVWSHLVRTGRGQCLVDRWPDPRTVVTEVAGNYSLRGNPVHLDDQPEPIAGFVEAPDVFFSRLRQLDPGLVVWNRVSL